MQTYLVGGAVRDMLLGLEVKDRDWVVVGATPELMTSSGYQQVGKDFPVFLHPKTREEYALARAERKVAPGHKGFECRFDTEVTLEEDLMRRDLTINALAMSQDQSLIDPYKGQQDLRDKVLRHVSSAFIEDPLRVYRVARFAAKLPEFSVHKSTLDMMRKIVTSGELETLSRERVVAELRKALMCAKPWVFLKVLADVGVKDILAVGLDWTLAEQAGCIVSPENEQQSLMMLLWGQSTKLAQYLLGLGLPQDLKRVCETQPVWSTFTANSQPNASDWIELLGVLDAWRRPQLLEIYLKAYDADMGQNNQAKWCDLYTAYKAIKWSEILSDLPQDEIVEHVSRIKLGLINTYL